MVWVFVEKNRDGLGVFASYIRVVVGEGFGVRFWHDTWC